MNAPATPAPVDVAVAPHIPTWVLLAVLALAAAVVWLVGFDNGQASAVADHTGSFLHELFHDARHLSGAPCH
jgi:hypothetical protein